MATLARLVDGHGLAHPWHRIGRWAKVSGAHLWNEPFIQFLLVGGLISIGFSYHQADRNRYTIEIGPAQQEAISAAYVQQFGQEPAQKQLNALIERFVREEIYVREGLALGLATNDEIVRRRIAQKYEFLQTDLAVIAQPDEKTLQGWFERNKGRYKEPARVSFEHVFFSEDRGGTAAATERAEEILARLQATSPAQYSSDLGDPFPGPTEAHPLSQEELRRLFGESELSEQLFTMAVGEWRGPLHSGFGWHLVRVIDHVPGTVPSLSDVRERVLADYMEEQRRLANAHAIERLRAKYHIQFSSESK